jgi:hypothetical protein
MKLIYIYLFICFFALSCAKDKGNYNYTTLNPIAISGIGNVVNVKQFDTLKLQPTVTTQTNVSALSYSWYFINSGTGAWVNVVLSNKKDLVSPVTITPGVYTLYFKVTDGTNSTSQYTSYVMNVTGALPEGWLLGYNRPANSSDAALILPSGQILSDLLLQTNKRHFKGTIKTLANYSTSSNKQYMFCITDQEGMSINALDFSITATYDNSFYSPPTVKNYVADYSNIGDGFYEDYLFNGTQIHKRLWGSAGAAGFIPKFPLAFEGDYEAAPFLMGTPRQFFGPYPDVIYDEKHNQFMYVPLNQLGFIAFPKFTAPAFDLSNMGNKTMSFAYNAPDGSVTTLFKDRTTGSLFIYHLDLSKARSTAGLSPAVDMIAVDPSKTPDLAAADFYSMSPNLPILYYSKGNKLYKYDITANQSTLLYSFANGVAITAINILNPQKAKAFADVGNRFAVATLEGTEGVFYEFSVLPTGSFAGNNYSKMYKNNLGKITSIYYKVPL